MSSGPGRQLRGLLLLLGGLAGLAASPAAWRLRHGVLARFGRPHLTGDPVSPFRQAPCYGRDAEDTEGAARRTEALP